MSGRRVAAIRSMSDVPDRSTPVLLVMRPTRLPRKAVGTSVRKTSMPDARPPRPETPTPVSARRTSA